MKNIKVVLTKYSDLTANVLYLLTGFGYTHVSLALDGDDAEMYSFNYKGFCVETAAKHRRRGVRQSKCYHLKISDRAHDRLKKRVEHFIAHREEYSYTKFGVVCCVLGIPFRRNKRYFCSQFVAEMLSQTGAIRLRKKPSLYLPNHFCRELAQCAQLLRIQYNPI